MSRALYDVIGGVTRKVDKQYLALDGVTRKIKKSYQVVAQSCRELEYIQSTGTQYIDTGITATGSTKVVLDCEITYGSSWTMIMGSYNSGAYFSWWGNGSKLSAYYGSSNKTLAGPTGRTTLTADGNVWSAGDVSTTFTAGSFTAAGSMYLFSIRSGGNYTNVSMRLYSCKIYQGGVLVRDFAPCLAADGSVGLWDKVSEKLYSNLGSGTFTAGSETGALLKSDRVARLFYSSEIGVSYIGEHTTSDITVDGVNYTLWTLKKSGTLTVSEPVQYWMCGGGGRGADNKPNGPAGSAGGGGAGGYAADGTIEAGTHVVSIGGPSGNTMIGSNVANAGSDGGTGDAGTVSGGSGGTGGGTGSASHMYWGTGDGIDKHPFGLSELKAHCPGGAGGAVKSNYSNPNSNTGGTGGTNGGDGNYGAIVEDGDNIAAAEGGTYGGGKGGAVVNGVPQAGSDGSFYGAGGGGGAHLEGDATIHSGGYGYQGVVYLLVPKAA